MKKVALVVQWLKSCAETVGTWWGIMSGALSIPFALLALFNFPPRLVFAALAYISLWVLVIAQRRRISELQGSLPSSNVTVLVERDLIDVAEDFDARVPATGFAVVSEIPVTAEWSDAA